MKATVDQHSAARHPRGDVAAGEHTMIAGDEHQTAAVIEKVEAAGLSPLAGSSVAIPIPTPSVVGVDLDDQRDDNTSEDHARATRLIMMVSASSSRCSGGDE